MHINKEKFMALSLSMSVGLTAACKKKAPETPMDNRDSGFLMTLSQDPTNEGVISDAFTETEQFNNYGACEEVILDGESRYFSWDLYNECHIECDFTKQGDAMVGAEQSHCYDIWDECTDWDNTGECIQFELMEFAVELPDGCTQLVVEEANFFDPTFECYEWK
jgi:hypothetical protein